MIETRDRSGPRPGPNPGLAQHYRLGISIHSVDITYNNRKVQGSKGVATERRKRGIKDEAVP
jgi:hypothetical protein